MPIKGPVSGENFSGSPSVCRKVRRRELIKTHRQQWYREGLVAITELAGYSQSESGQTSAVLNSCLTDLERQYFETGKPPVGLSADGALKELLGKCTAYFDRTDLVSYDPALLALPEAGTRLPLSDHLRFEHRSFVDDSMQYLLVDENPDNLSSSGNVKPYCDPVLFSSESSYADFLSKLYSRGMLKFDRSRGRAGNMFFFCKEEKWGY